MRALEDRLRTALSGPLPGHAAQVRLARRPRHETALEPRGDGGVLVLLYPRAGEPHFVLTVRTAGLRRHAGQVSLPGGMVEPGESPLDAALREAAEEVAAVPRDLRVVGALTPLFMPHTGVTVHPYVALADARPPLHPAEREVARILEVPLAHLLDAERTRTEIWTFEGRPYEVPHFSLEGEKVWGATAMILAELKELVAGDIPLFPS